MLNPSRLEEYRGISNRRRVWFQCSAGHIWLSTIAEVKGGQKCPKCAPANTSFPEQALFFYLKRFAPSAEHRRDLRVKGKQLEVDIYLPEFHLGIEYDGPHHVQKTQKDEEKNFLLQRNHVQLIRVRVMGLPQIRAFGSVVLTHDPNDPRSLERCLRGIGTYLQSHFELTDEQSHHIATWNDVNIDEDRSSILSNKYSPWSTGPTAHS